MRIRRTVRIAIASARASYRKQAGVVAIALLDQHVERPLPAPHDREARRAKARDFLACEVFQQLLGSANRLAEHKWCLRRNARMVPAVRRYLVSRRRNRANELGLPLRYPAEDEERGPRAVLLQQL